MPDRSAVRGSLVLDDRGLHLPGSVAGREGGFVIRTPASTHDVRSLSPGVNVWPMVSAREWEVTEDEAANPDLLPDRVRLKVYGEDATTWAVSDQTGGED